MVHMAGGAWREGFMSIPTAIPHPRLCGSFWPNLCVYAGHFPSSWNATAVIRPGPS